MRTLRAIACALAALGVLALAAWLAAPLLVADPMPGVHARTPVRTWCDRNGVPLYCERTWQYEWRFDVPLASIPQEVVDVMLAVEDSRFYEHGGIDYRAICRAAVQNAAAGRVVSGASTISMQTAAMDYHQGRRNLAQKFVQTAKTRKMERLHTKDEILEAYFNNLPFGGNIYGIEAAARFYFGLHAAELGVAEASILCGLPQRPNRLRPDRHPDAARRRQELVLRRLVATGILTQDGAAAVAAARPRYRDFSHPALFEQLGSPREWGFLIGKPPAMRHGAPQEVRLEIDASLCHAIRAVLARRAAAAQDVRDAACVVVEVATGATAAYVGTRDFDSPAGGQIDAARALRSAGSALKPFIYLEAMLGGRLVADSPMTDAPVRFSEYRPKNSGGGYAGRVSAADALSRSLNTPAVRLLASLGEARVSHRFAALGLSTRGQATTNGLSLALGTAGYRLLDITRAYAKIAPPTSMPPAAPSAPAGNDGHTAARAMLAEMLRSRPLPGTSLPVAWKTGTSNGNHDAWCFGYTPDYAVGVWFGNKDGSRAEALVGAEIAAPAVGEIFEMLYAHRAAPLWPFAPDYAVEATLCTTSGLKASPSCRDTFAGRAIRGLPLAECETCAGHRAAFSIVSPHPGEYRLADGAEALDLPLRATAAGATWFLDGRMLDAGTASVRLLPGRHTIAAVPDDPAMPTAQVSLTLTSHP